MNKKQFTISKLNNLKNNLSSIVTWMNNMIEVNSNFPKEFETKDIMIPYLKTQKDLYNQMIDNIEEIIKTLKNIKGENDPYINHILISSFNIVDHIGNPKELFDYCID